MEINLSYERLSDPHPSQLGLYMRLPGSQILCNQHPFHAPHFHISLAVPKPHINPPPERTTSRLLLSPIYFSVTMIFTIPLSLQRQPPHNQSLPRN